MTVPTLRTVVALLAVALLAAACEELPTPINGTATPSPDATVTELPLATTTPDTPAATATSSSASSTSAATTPVADAPDGLREVLQGGVSPTSSSAPPQPATVSPAAATAIPTTTPRAAKAIQFPPGTTSTVVEGDVGLDRAERYTLRAAGGQVMVVGLQLPDPSDTGWLRVVGPEGFASPPGARPRAWIARLPVSAEYVLEVRTMIPHAARYQLGVGIETVAPQRVFFAPGDTGAALTGALPARSATAYRLGAEAGQIFRLAVQPMSAVVFELLGPDRRPLAQSDAAMGSRFWELPADGDYELLLGAPFEPVEYRASVEIRSPAP